jgi:N-methylhydantoinase B
LTVDPLSLQVFANLFSSIADEMGVSLQRSSFSPNIKVRRDFSCALFDAEGNLLAQAAHIPVHLGAMPMAMRAVRDRFDLGPNDTVILNDPFAGGTHLPDISLVSAAFSAEGTRLGYVMSRAHHADVGGMSPGSMPLSTEIFQEGLIIPPVLLVDRGTLNQALMELILRNVRTPEERRGDFAAQLAAQHAGETGLARLAERYGIEPVVDHGRALQSYSEKLMRSLVGRIEPGVYEFQDFLDDDGQSEDPVLIRVAIRRDADSTDLEVDFSGSSPQRSGAINAVAAVTVSATLYVMRCLLGEDTPVNQGSLVPLRVIAPCGTVVSAQAPAAVAGGNVETSQRIVDVLFGALSGALPDLVPAASQGTMNNLAFGGEDHARARHFAYYETMGGGMGARPKMDGLSGVHDHMSNTLNTPVEVIESEYPLVVDRYELREGTGGSGAHEGGAGLRRDLRFLEHVTVTILSERRRRPPYGLRGGEPGTVGQNVLIRAGESRPLAGKITLGVEPGDVISIQSPGGGGFGRLA